MQCIAARGKGRVCCFTWRDYAAYQADSDDDYAEQDDYTIEKILAQCLNPSMAGGYGPSHDTWEPISSFVPRVNTQFMEFVRKHKIPLQVSDLEALARVIEVCPQKEYHHECCLEGRAHGVKLIKRTSVFVEFFLPQHSHAYLCTVFFKKQW